MQHPFSALLLAGGRSVRMGTEKALLDFQGKPLWKHQIEKLEAIGAAEILVSRHPDQSSIDFGYPVVMDDSKESGPLGGIVAGLHACQHPHLLVLAVDLPLISISTLKMILNHSSPDQGSVFQQDRYLEPLVACYPKKNLPDARDSLQSGEKSLQILLERWILEKKMFPLSCAPGQTSEFQNANTPQDWGAITTAL